MLELIYDFIEHPLSAARRVQDSQPVAMGVAAYLAGAVGLFLAQALCGRLYVLGASLFGLALVCLWRLASGFFLSGLLHMLAEAMGGKGRAVPLFILMGFSDLGWTLALPGALVLRAAFPASAWPATFLFAFVAFITLRLKARSISDNYQLSRSKAWLTLALPYLAVVFTAMAGFSLAVAGAVHQILKLVA